MKQRQQIQKYKQPQEEEKVPFDQINSGGPSAFAAREKNAFTTDQDFFDPEAEKPFEYKYVKPDISKRQVCKEDMPIQGAKEGKYNLNWLDDQNEGKFIMNAENYLAKGECPIQGMDRHVFEEIINEMDYETQKDLYGVKNRFMKQFPIKRATKQSLTKTCAICCNYYKLE